MGKEESFRELSLMDIGLIAVMAVLSVTLLLKVFELEVFAGIKLATLVLVIWATSKAAAQLAGTKSSWGIVLLRSTKFLQTIDSIAKKHKRAVLFLADVGIVAAFGALSLLILKEDRLKKLAIGTAFLVLMAILVTPSIFPVASSLIKANEIEEYKTVSKTTNMPSEIGLAIIGITALFGYAVAGFFALVLQSLFTLNLAWLAVIGELKPEQITPGAVPVIPGITIPLFEGILALMMILVVHEGAHGVLARIEGIRVKNTGIALIGAIPAGAFVDPDEKELFKKQPLAITRIISAGPVSNLYLCFLLFLVLLAMAQAGIRGNPFWTFAHKTLLLAFVLNYMVGLINLLPVTFFDGFHLVNANIKNKGIAKAITYSALGMFLLIVAPILLRI